MMTARAIIAAAARVFDVPESIITGGGKKRAIVKARSAAALVIRREMPDRSLPRIAHALGASDHSSAIHWIRSAQRWECDDSDYGVRVARVAAIAGEYASAAKVPAEYLPDEPAAAEDDDAAHVARERLFDDKGNSFTVDREGYDANENEFHAMLVRGSRRLALTIGSQRLAMAIARERAAA